MSALRPLRILVVEDEGLIAMDIEATIEDEGHIAVGWARSAGEALELYGSTEPDLAFLDVQLVDGTTGIQVANELQTRGGARYVFLTANASVVGDDMHGGIGVIQKPVSHTQLVDILQYLHNGLLDPPPMMDKPNALKLAAGFKGFE